MATVGIVYYSMYGTTHDLSKCIAKGVKSAGGTPELRLVPELLPQAVIDAQGLQQVKDRMSEVAEASVDELPSFDGVIFGSPTRYGSATSQLQSFFDQTGPLWQSGALVGKPAGFFTGASTMHGGFESTVLSMSTFAFHQGMLIVPAGYAAPETMETQTGGSPYGPSHWSPMGDQKDGLSDSETAIAEHYGGFFNGVADKLAG